MTNQDVPELWTVDQIAHYLGIGHESVRKTLWRKKIKLRHGYPAAEIKAAWPQNRKAPTCD